MCFRGFLSRISQRTLDSLEDHSDAGSVGHVADAASVGIHGSRTSNIGILIKLADAGSVGHGSGPGMSHREVITRGSLLHWYRPGKVHFVTYRLAGTLPIELIRRLRTERDERLARPTAPGVSYGKAKENAHKQFFAAYDKYLDQSLCVRWLEEPAVAEIVVENLYHHHQVKYQLLEYAVMPNHVHVLILPIESNAGGAGNLTDASSVGHVADAASIGQNADSSPDIPGIQSTGSADVVGPLDDGSAVSEDGDFVRRVGQGQANQEGIARDCS